MLPANLRMMNYVTDVMYSETAASTVPEPMQRRTTELLVICDEEAQGRVSAVMQALGAANVRKR